MPASRTRTRPALTLRAVAEIGAAAEGKPRTFRMVANTGEPMRLYPWEHPVVVDLDTVDLSGVPLPALYDHCAFDPEFVVGTVTEAAVEGANLVAAGRFAPTANEKDYANRVLAKADAGHVWQVSVGGDPAQVDEVRAGQSVQVNGRTYAGPVCVARRLQLREISFVVLGGDRRTSAVVARHAVRGSSAMPTFEEYVASLGFDPAALDDTQTANLKLQYAEAYPEGAEETVTNAAAEMPTDEAIAGMSEEDVVRAMDDASKMPAANCAALMPKLTARLKALKAGKAAAAQGAAAVAAERNRVARITALVAQHGDPRVAGRDSVMQPLSVVATADGWAVERVQATLLDVTRSSRPVGPTVLAPAAASKEQRVQALQAAMILRSGGRLDYEFRNLHPVVAARLPAWLRAGVNDEARQRAMDAAHGLYDLHAMDLARECAELDGRRLSSKSRESILEAAFSGLSLSNVFTTNINTILLQTYLQATDTTVGWVREQEVPDFRLNERPRMLKGAQLNKLGKGGTADDMTRDDVSESYKAARYAGKITVDEQDMINDWLGAFADLPVEMGNAAARLRPDLVYSVLLGNPALAATGRTLFNATDANTATGAALASATLRSACSAMMAVRESGVNLNLMPSHLIVPTELFFLGNELTASATIVIAGTAGAVTERGSKNVLSDLNLTVVSDGRLQNGVTDPDSGTTYSGSTSTWYLASNMAHTIEVGYVRGTGRAPRVRPYKIDKGQYGAGWDVSMDIGVKALDWKGFQRRQA